MNTKKFRINAWEEKIKKIVSSHKNLNEKCNAAINAGVLNADGSFFNAIWSSFEEMMAIIDKCEWVNWYIYENEYGKNKLKAGHNGKINRIITPRQLAKLIVEDQDRYPDLFKP